MLGCAEKFEQPNPTVDYTYSIQTWESLGSQTLVVLDAENSSSLTQEITFKVEVVNTNGRVFTKDTTIQFEKDERQKNFQLIVDTEGEIKGVNVSTVEVM